MLMVWFAHGAATQPEMYERCTYTVIAGQLYANDCDLHER